MKLNVKQCKVAVALALGLSAGFAAAPLSAETCLSPYIKGLKQPENVMYLWSLPAVADGGPDFLAMIDVNLASPTYGKILKKIFVVTSLKATYGVSDEGDG